MRLFALAFIVALVASQGQSANAAYILQIDTDGSTVDGPDPDGAGPLPIPELITYHPNFMFGGDTTSILGGDSVASPAVGMTGGDSIFGGNGTAQPDTYLYKYTPSVDGNNLVLAAGTALNDNGNVSSGMTAGGSGLYTFYATWPRTTNVTGGPTRYILTAGATTLFSVDINQNTILDNSIGTAPTPLGGGGEWVPLASVNLVAGTNYTLSQSPSSANTFVSMRAAGILIEPGFVRVPEPTTLCLVTLGIAAWCSASRRRRTG